MKQHFLIMVTNDHGGFITSTLCGRENSLSPDGVNGVEAIEDVTCAFCRTLHGNEKAWRWRKYVQRMAK